MQATANFSNTWDGIKSVIIITKKNNFFRAVIPDTCGVMFH